MILFIQIFNFLEKYILNKILYVKTVKLYVKTVKLEEANFLKELYVTKRQLLKFEILIFIIIAIIGDLIYKFVSNKSIIIFTINFVSKNLLIFIIGSILFSVIHEIIHFLTFAIVRKGQFNDISIGFDIKNLNFYTLCSKHLRAIEYIYVLASPLIILGVIPYIIGLLSHNIYIASVGLFMIQGGAGDIIYIFLIKNLPFNTKIKTHDLYYGFSIKN